MLPSPGAGPPTVELDKTRSGRLFKPTLSQYGIDGPRLQARQAREDSVSKPGKKDVPPFTDQAVDYLLAVESLALRVALMSKSELAQVLPKWEAMAPLLAAGAWEKVAAKVQTAEVTRVITAGGVFAAASAERDAAAAARAALPDKSSYGACQGAADGPELAVARPRLAAAQAALRALAGTGPAKKPERLRLKEEIEALQATVDELSEQEADVWFYADGEAADAAVDLQEYAEMLEPSLPSASGFSQGYARKGKVS